MLTITFPDSTVITASTDVMLAAQLADREWGEGWDNGIDPFDEHTLMGEMFELIAHISDGNIPGHPLTTTEESASNSVDT
ncbi:hypothetical protein [Plantibacter sp. RU18]|uniref:hypothetical protein n=1 Tax=Plantibacter sp. RU18 TaxID=3158143 RepID=UPI003D36F1CB